MTDKTIVWNWCNAHEEFHALSIPWMRTQRARNLDFEHQKSRGRVNNKQRRNSWSSGSKPGPLDKSSLKWVRPKNTARYYDTQSCHNLGRDQRPPSPLPMKDLICRGLGYNSLKSHLCLSEIRSSLVYRHLNLTYHHEFSEQNHIL